MSNAPDQLSPIFGLPPVTMERYVRALREAGLLPTGKRGGGRGAVHMGPRDLARIVIGMAGNTPSEAPMAVAVLADMPIRRLLPMTQDEPIAGASGEAGTKLPEPMTLLDCLVDEIAMCGQEIFGGSFTPGMQLHLDTFEVQLCLGPPSGRVKFSGIRSSHEFVAGAAEAPGNGLRRVAIFNGRVIAALGILWADSKFHQIAADRIAALNMIPSSSSAPETENAAPRKAASPENQNHDAVPGIDTSDDTGCSPVSQPLRRGSDRSSLFERTDRHEHAHRVHAHAACA